MLNTLLSTTTALTDTLQVPVNTDNGTNVFGFIMGMLFASFVLYALGAYLNDSKLGTIIMGILAAASLAVFIFMTPILTIDTPAVQAQIAADTGVVLNTDTISTTVFKAKENIGDKIAFTDGGTLGYITVTKISTEGAEIEYKLHN